MAKTIASLALILAATLCASATFAAQSTYDRTLNAPAGGRLTFDADVGSVSVVGSDAQRVTVHAELEGSESALRRLHISAEQTPAGVTVSAREERSGWLDWFDFSSISVRFTVEVPRGYPIDLRTSGGGLDLRQLSAPIDARTSGGGINLQDVSGNVHAHTSGGGIRAERVAGSVELSTSGGPIDVADSTGDLDLHTSGGGIDLRNDDGKVDAGTSGGSIHAELRSNRGISLVTSGGGITLLLPQDTHASIDAGTSGGGVTCDFPVTTKEFGADNHLQGTIGGGGPSIYLHTSGGGIRIGRSP
jgi:DUF4097 and DUF4098 domain-containing protein YvlB